MECQRWPEKPLKQPRSQGLSSYRPRNEVAPKIGEVWNSVCCHGNKTVKLVYCGAHLVEYYCEESIFSDTTRLRYLSSYLMKFS